MSLLTDPVRAVIVACVILLLAAWLMLYGFSGPLPEHSRGAVHQAGALTVFYGVI